MAKKTIRTRSISLGIDEGTFRGFIRRFRGKKTIFSNIADLRQLFSNERARLITTIKTKNPLSIYHLAKLLGRDFKSVRQDVRLLEKFGFLELTSKKKGKREMLKPILAANRVKITVDI